MTIRGHALLVPSSRHLGSMQEPKTAALGQAFPFDTNADILADVRAGREDAHD